ncbi:hypothetical protein AYI69_g9067 [Smittium culicis]|uniref:CCHC-type domain-containing protein n=1 Tax=Smittium culicis TaxID=133412 RepID=A0A1R1XF38_9FUNG|nr:hypothetical protein AYI69_g9067 [Smittium culicis]
MVIRNPVKRARSLFSDIVKGDDPEYATNAELNSKTVNSSSRCLKRFCVAGSDQKIGIDWGQFKGDVPEALNVGFNAICDSLYTRYDDYRANVTYITLYNLEDATNLMSKTLTYEDQKIYLYQTVKMEEDIMTVNIPNFKEISITKMVHALCNKDRNECIPYGMKVLLRKNTIDTKLTLFLDHEDGRIIIFYRGFKEVCSYCKKDIHWKSECSALKNIASKKKIMNDMTKSSLKFSLPEQAMLGFSIPSASLSKYDVLKTNANKTWKHYTPKTSVDDKGLPKNESSATKFTTISRRRGTKVSPDEDTESDVGREEVEPQKTKSINKKNFESDDSQDSSSIAGSSSPIEIKKEYLAPRSNIFESSEGNNTPSEHDVMAEKARLGKISEKEFMDYVHKVDCASQCSNIAGMDLDSDPPDQSSSGIDI